MRIQATGLAIAICFLTVCAARAETVQVQPGDTLSKIADRLLGGGNRWLELCEANRARLRDCNKIAVGTILTLPSAGKNSPIQSDAVIATDATEATGNTIAAAVSEGGGRSDLDVTLNCGSSGNNGPFTRKLKGEIDPNGFSLSRGAPGEQGYEVWKGLPEGVAAFSMTGTYIEGDGGEKPIKFAVRQVGEYLFGSGQRGPRDCNFTAKRQSAD